MGRTVSQWGCSGHLKFLQGHLRFVHFIVWLLHLDKKAKEKLAKILSPNLPPTRDGNAEWFVHTRENQPEEKGLKTVSAERFLLAETALKVGEINTRVSIRVPGELELRWELTSVALLDAADQRRTTRSPRLPDTPTRYPTCWLPAPQGAHPRAQATHPWTLHVLCPSLGTTSPKPAISLRLGKSHHLSCPPTSTCYFHSCLLLVSPPCMTHINQIPSYSCLKPSDTFVLQIEQNECATGPPDPRSPSPLSSPPSPRAVWHQSQGPFYSVRCLCTDRRRPGRDTAGARGATPMEAATGITGYLLKHRDLVERKKHFCLTRLANLKKDR